MESVTNIKIDTNKHYKYAFVLAVITISYNLIEGLVSTYFGYEDESLALFGFGVDSFIEVISGLGIAHMVIRIQRNPDSNRDDFERTALRITGVAFYLLVAGLVTSSVYNTWTGHKPETTFWGMVIAIIVHMKKVIYKAFGISGKIQNTIRMARSTGRKAQAAQAGIGAAVYQRSPTARRL